MPAELLLIAITCIVAIVATIWRDPPFRTKVFLIILAVLASAGSVFKAIEDESDKRFTQSALIATLVPSGSTFQRFYDDLDKPVPELGYEPEDSNCHHSDVGMNCFLKSKANSKSGVVVFDRTHVAELYANLLRRESNQPEFDRLLKTVYLPSVEDEEFKNKAGIVGMHVFYDMYDRDAQEYYI